MDQNFETRSDWARVEIEKSSYLLSHMIPLNPTGHAQCGFDSGRQVLPCKHFNHLHGSISFSSFLIF